MLRRIAAQREIKGLTERDMEISRKAVFELINEKHSVSPTEIMQLEDKIEEATGKGGGIAMAFKAVADLVEEGYVLEKGEISTYSFTEKGKQEYLRLKRN